MKTFANDLVVTTSIVVETCCNCGIVFGLSYEFKQGRLKDHRDWYCPNGHGQHYTGQPSAEQERDRLKRQLEYATASRDAYKDQAETAEHRRRAEKGAKTKLQKRIAAGVCPCCHRSFQNLARHMAGQHPDFPAEVSS